MNSHSLVVKENSLITASYNLTLIEQRLILLAIIVIREHTHKNELDYVAFDKPVRVYAEDYIRQFNIKSPSTAYEGLKDASKALFQRQFSYQEKRKKGVANITSRWVSDIAYIDNEAVVEVTFARAVIPLITELERNLTSYEIKQVSQLTSGYAIRIYELLIAWKTKGKSPKFSIDDFKVKLGLTPSQYPRMDNFKRIVMKPAVKQINKHTDITIKLNQYKEGRRVAGFWFDIKMKPQEKDVTPTRDPNTGDMFTIDGLTDKQLRRITRHKDFVSVYSRLASGDASRDWDKFSEFMINEIKKNPHKFSKKRPIREYLDGSDSDYHYS